MFPFNHPAPTAFYLVLYLGTMVLHVVPMNYVLAGSTYLAVQGCWEVFFGRATGAKQAIAQVLRDWMPFALSIAITAGVAPLLFIQVLYKEPFYTANLLLFHRWMAILPVLIVAFYLLYLQKSKRFQDRGSIVRAVVSVGIMACFGFVAWSWTENHLLSTQGQEVWVQQYAEGGWFYHNQEHAARLPLWWLGAFVNLAVVLVWQLRGKGDEPTCRYLAAIGLGALLIAGLLGGTGYAMQMPGDALSLVKTTGWPYLVLAGLAACGLGYAWYRVLRQGVPSIASLVLLSTAAVVLTFSATVLREVRRLASLDITQFYDQHRDASQVAGLVAFLFFLVLNTVLIAWVIRMVNAAKPHAEAQSHRE